MSGARPSGTGAIAVTGICRVSDERRGWFRAPGKVFPSYHEFRFEHFEARPSD